ncbi:MAG TPA: hypothetical protein VK552_10760, partial [Reyranella sp.]|nr:hypothetical protein [Reyranella sp.]
MAEPEARIVINRNPEDPVKAPKFADAKAVGDQIRARRKQIHQQAKIDAVGGIAPESVEMPPPPVREDLETIEFTAPNGLLIEYGPRHDISLVDRIARLYSGRDPTVSEFRLTRILMGIRTINGSPATTITDEISRTKLANQVGDEVIDLLMYYDRIHWPPLQQSELPVLRKKLRT